MALVSMRGISLSFGAERLLDQVDLNIESGDRACLVGRNGAGKSSLLKILHGDLLPDEGDVTMSTESRVSYLAQDVPADLSGSVEQIASSWVSGSSGSDAFDDSGHVIGKIENVFYRDWHTVKWSPPLFVE